MSDKNLRIKKNKKPFFYKDMTPALVLPLAMAVHLYSYRALLLCAVSVLSAVIFDIIGCRITNQKFVIKDFSSIYIGALLSLMLPASAPLWLPVLGSAFAVLIIKIPFGGVKSAPFSCTAAAFSFLSICRPAMMFAYPTVNSDASASVFGSESFVAGTSVAHLLAQENPPAITAVDIINAAIGTVPGPMGMTSAVIMAGILVYLLVKRPKSFINSVSFLLTCLIGAAVSVALKTGRLFCESSLRLVFMYLCSGLTLCIAVFLITEESLSPKKTPHRIFYGATAAVIYMILRRVSVFEDAGCFAVLTANFIWPLAEKYIFNGAFFKRNKTAEVSSVE